jgi:hypothetical protein
MPASGCADTPLAPRALPEKPKTLGSASWCPRLSMGALLQNHERNAAATSKYSIQGLLSVYSISEAGRWSATSLSSRGLPRLQVERTTPTYRPLSLSSSPSRIVLPHGRARRPATAKFATIQLRRAGRSICICQSAPAQSALLAVPLNHS